MSAESLSLEETNKVRLSLGLKPLGDPSAAAATGLDGEAAEPVKTEDEIAVENFKRQRDAEDAVKSDAALAARLDKAKTKRDLKSKLSGKGLGEADDDEGGGAKSWVKKSKKRAKEVAADLARRRAEEQEAMDAELQARYDESDLKGMRVGHDMEDFAEGQDNILTLRDSRLMGVDDDDDELENVNLADYKRTEERMDRKTKGKNAHEYTGLDDEEFATGKKAGILSKYDADIKDDSIPDRSGSGFTLGGQSAGSATFDDANTFEAVSRPIVKTSESKQELAKELNRTLVDLNYEKTIDNGDYLKEGDAGFKKTKKKKKAKPTSTRRTDADEPTITRTSQAELDAQALLDDDELQSSLARQRRMKNRKAVSAMKDRALPSAQEDVEMVKEEEDEGEGVEGLVLDDTSEFVRGIQLQPAAVKRERLSPVPPPVSENGNQAKVEEVPEEGGMEIDDAAEEARLLAGDEIKEEAQTDAVLGSTSGELTHNKGMGATLAMLRQSGLVKPMTPEEMAAENEYKQKQRWLAARRQDEARIAANRQASKAAGSSKDQHQREMENKQRDREQAARDLDRFKDYKPNVDIKYTDEFGREMTQKEAWKYLSHEFHGKGSGTNKQVKRLKKYEDEKKAAAMASGDTPLSTNAAFQARQERLGSATMLLSVGNKMTAPHIEDFQSSVPVDPSKQPQQKGKQKGKGKAGQGSGTPAPEINLTPTLDAPQASMVPRKAAGFKPITKRAAEESLNGDEANKRSRLD